MLRTAGRRSSARPGTSPARRHGGDRLLASSAGLSPVHIFGSHLRSAAMRELHRVSATAGAVDSVVVVCLALAIR
ncbi:hypothetical protein HBB16_17640, partial [Pseudonocardia sp. MCCB 268]|nr:hypothetical protein [Pseudonocardia cytotoxica]